MQIIRLSCIEEDTGLKYRMCSEAEQEQVSEFGGGAINGHEVESTHDMGE